MTRVVDLVKDDVSTFMKSNQELLFNERDLQMHLALWLKASENKYDDVDIEYYVPNSELEGYGDLWDNELLRIDIVVRKGSEYVPIELKYKTKGVNWQISRFGIKLSKEVLVVKNQGAQNRGMYDFWKDVKRIELLRRRFDNIHNGLAIFVTNDEMYIKGSKETSDNYPFNISEGKHSIHKYWQKHESKLAESNPCFDVETEYTIHWESTIIKDEINDEKFYYTIVTI